MQARPHPHRELSLTSKVLRESRRAGEHLDRYFMTRFSPYVIVVVRVEFELYAQGEMEGLQARLCGLSESIDRNRMRVGRKRMTRGRALICEEAAFGFGRTFFFFLLFFLFLLLFSTNVRDMELVSYEKEYIFCGYTETY